MNIAFFGSPGVAKEILESIHEKYPISLVVSQPNKPVGRKKEITPTPVAAYAVANNIPVATPESLQGFKLPPVDLVIVVAYGMIIPQDLLEQPIFGFINVHYSLLPKYRGASPVQAAILNGDKKTGVTIMKMDEELDHGEIISQKEVSIDFSDTSESMLEKLTNASKPLLLDVIDHIHSNNKLPDLKAQDHSKATYCDRIEKQDAFVEFKEVKKAINNEQLSMSLHNKIRAYYPWPMVWTLLPNGKRCKIISSVISSETEKSQKTFQLTEIQIEGKQRTKDQQLIKNVFRNDNIYT